jgi:hypothetical protein
VVVIVPSVVELEVGVYTAWFLRAVCTRVTYQDILGKEAAAGKTHQNAFRRDSTCSAIWE